MGRLVARLLALALVVLGILVVILIVKPTLLLNVGGEELARSLMREIDGSQSGTCNRTDEANTWHCELVTGGSEDQGYQLITEGDCWEARELRSGNGANENPRSHADPISGCVSVIDFNPLAAIEIRF